jgi:PST family polysaccharide transporter
MGAAAGVRVTLGVAAQVLLGWYLAEDDFGVYAIAIGFSAFLTMFKQGGVNLVLMRRAPEDVRRMAGSGLLLAGGASVAVAAALAASSSVVAKLYGEPQVRSILLIVSLSLVIDIYGIVATAYLQAQMRFRAVAALETASVTLQYTLAVGLAIRGWGPLSFAVPLVFTAALRTAVGFVLTRGEGWSYRPRAASVKELFAEARWGLGGTTATVLLRQADYAVLGLLVSSSVVGVYYFAYQLTHRLLQFFTESMRKVVVPTFGRLVLDVRRRGVALLSGSQLAAVLVIPLPVALSLVAEPLEELLWRGRWQDAVQPIRLLAIAMAVEVMVLIVNMVVQAAGLFRAWTLQALGRGAGLAVMAVTAGWLGGDDVVVITAILASYLIVSGVAQAALLLRVLEVSPRDFGAAVAPGFVVAGIAAMAAFAATRGFGSAVPPAVEILALTLTFGLVFGGSVRALARRRVFSRLPDVTGLRGVSLAMRLLGLRAGAAQVE